MSVFQLRRLVLFVVVLVRFRACRFLLGLLILVWEEVSLLLSRVCRLLRRLLHGAIIVKLSIMRILTMFVSLLRVLPILCVLIAV